MQTIRHKSVAYLVSISLAVSSMLLPGVSRAYTDMNQEAYSNAEPDEVDMALDALAVRPLMIIYTVLSTATFIVSLPFTALGGNVGEAGQKLVVEPAKYTFVRPLGQMKK